MRGKRSQLSGEVLEHRITPAHAGKTACRPCSPRIRADHPRACGENRTYLTKKQHAGGSPPRMRGKLIPPRKCLYKTRITPAHAGKTCAHDSAHAGVADHPRACGENSTSLVTQRLKAGSPPRMRGKPVGWGFSDLATRITPAHAGKTLQIIFTGLRLTDHPRACGEN